MTPDKFFRLCQIYSDLGANMQCQFMTIVREYEYGDEEDIAEAICNHNPKELPLIQEALNEIIHFLEFDCEELSSHLIKLSARLQRVIDHDY